MKKPKTVIPKSESSWWKYSVSWKNADLCRSLSMPLATYLHLSVRYLYFARYMSVAECRTDYYFSVNFTVSVPEKTLSNMRLAFEAFAKIHKINLKLAKPVPCEGSYAHALALEVVLNIYNKHLARGPEDESPDNDDMLKAWTLLADVFHWSSNMLGIDYCDEAKLHLYSIDRIINIFQGSIKKGNKLSKLSEKLVNKRASNN